MRQQTENIAMVLTLLFVGLFMYSSVAAPLSDLSDDSSSSSSEEDELLEETNGTAKNLYIIKAIVYEIGILTEADSDENDTSVETHERVDLTFFDAHTNESHIDLGMVPLPVQTNISGQVLTGIAPVNVGAFSHPSQLLETLPLTGTIVNITHSDTAYFQLAKNNSYGGNPPNFDPSEFSNIPGVLEMLPSLANHPNQLINASAEPKLNNSI